MWFRSSGRGTWRGIYLTGITVLIYTIIWNQLPRTQLVLVDHMIVHCVREVWVAWLKRGEQGLSSSCDPLEILGHLLFYGSCFNIPYVVLLTYSSLVWSSGVKFSLVRTVPPLPTWFWEMLTLPFKAPSSWNVKLSVVESGFGFRLVWLQKLRYRDREIGEEAMTPVHQIMVFLSKMSFTISLCCLVSLGSERYLANLTRSTKRLKS